MNVIERYFSELYRIVRKRVCRMKHIECINILPKIRSRLSFTQRTLRLRQTFAKYRRERGFLQNVYALYAINASAPFI